MANGKCRPDIKWYGCAGRNLLMMPSITGVQPLSTIINWVRSNLLETSSEPNLN